jgi:hypothetical protein
MLAPMPASRQRTASGSSPRPRRSDLASSHGSPSTSCRRRNRTTEESGLPAYVAPEVAAMVGEATVDTERSGDQVRLILRKETPTSE